MQSVEEKGQIRLEIHPQENFVEVIFSQGDYVKVHEVSDDLFKESGLKPESRNPHAVIECLIRESSFSVDPTQPRRKELQRFLSFLSTSKHEEFRELSSKLSVYLIEEWNAFIFVFILILIIILACIFYNKQ